MLKEYRTVYIGREAETVEKKSRFIATVQPVKTEEEALEFIEKMIPFINAAFEERGQHINRKYSRNRKGARSKQRTKAELIEDYGSGTEV